MLFTMSDNSNSPSERLTLDNERMHAVGQLLVNLSTQSCSWGSVLAEIKARIPLGIL